MAAKKYPGVEGGVEKLTEAILASKGPSLSGATVGTELIHTNTIIYCP